MMVMAKVVLLLLVVFKATALESSHETDSNHELSPLSYPPQSSTDVGERKQSTVECGIQCVLSCSGKSFFKKAICISVCLAKCAIIPTDSLDEIDCTVDCAQSYASNLRYGANLNDHISSCHQQCQRD